MPDHALIPSDIFGKRFKFPIFMETLRDRIDYCFSGCSVGVTSTVTVTLETSKSELCLAQICSVKAKALPAKQHERPFPKTEEKVTLRLNLAPSLREKPVAIWTGVVNLCVWVEGGAVHMRGFNSGFACPSFSIKSPLCWRAKSGRAVRGGAGVPSSLPTSLRLQRHLVAFFQPLHAAHPSLLRGHRNSFSDAWTKPSSTAILSPIILSKKINASLFKFSKRWGNTWENLQSVSP